MGVGWQTCRDWKRGSLPITNSLRDSAENGAINVGIAHPHGGRGEFCDVLEPALHDASSKVAIMDDAENSSADRCYIVRIHETGSAASDTAHGFKIGGDNGTADGLRLEDGQSKTFRGRSVDDDVA